MMGSHVKVKGSPARSPCPQTAAVCPCPLEAAKGPSGTARDLFPSRMCWKRGAAPMLLQLAEGRCHPTIGPVGAPSGKAGLFTPDGAGGVLRGFPGRAAPLRRLRARPGGGPVSPCTAVRDPAGSPASRSGGQDGVSEHRVCRNPQEALVPAGDSPLLVFQACLSTSGRRERSCTACRAAYSGPSTTWRAFPTP